MFTTHGIGTKRLASGLVACGTALLCASTALVAQGQVCIDFETNAPCFFSDTTALRDTFASQGINFEGPSQWDGGGILDQCAYFGIDARSGVDFLAFNRRFSDNFADNGVPRDPETIRFDADATAVSIWVSGGRNDAEWKMGAFDADGNLITSTTLSTTGGSYGELSLTGSGIRSVVIRETSGTNAFVMDDLCVDMGPIDCLTMTVSTLIGGQDASWDISGATAGSRVAVVYGTQAGQTIANGQSGFCATFGIDGVSQSKLVGTAIADGSGNASVIKMIPGNTSGLTILTQASEQGTCPDECMSGLDTQVVQ